MIIEGGKGFDVIHERPLFSFLVFFVWNLIWLHAHEPWIDKVKRSETVKYCMSKEAASMMTEKEQGIRVFCTKLKQYLHLYFPYSEPSL